MLPLTKKAYEAVIAQGEVSIEGTTCMYRGPRGLKCAAGHAIPDEVYEPGMEGLPFYKVVNQYNLDFSPEEVEELCKLQCAHDGSHSSSHFVETFKLLVQGRFTDATRS